MKLTLFSPDSYSTIILPSKCAGQYWLLGKNDHEASARIVAVEGFRSVSENDPDQWILKSNSRYQILAPDGSTVHKTPLNYLSVYMIRSVDHREEFRLYTEPVTEDRNTYQIYKIFGSNVSIRIGRGSDCDICYASPYIGKHHATLNISTTGMSILDNNSRNRTFLNGIAIQDASLKPGDVVFTMGMQIIVTKQFLYINNPDGKVFVHSHMLRPYNIPHYSLPPLDEDDIEDQEDFDDFYYPALRFKNDVKPFTLKLDPPPSGSTGDNMPLLMSIGPSITMGMASATTAAFSVVNAISSGNAGAAIPSVVMSLGMLSGTLLWPTLTKNYQKKISEKKEADRQSSYKSHLSKMEKQIEEEIHHQEKVLKINAPTCAELLNLVSSTPPQIWERTSKYSDFLRIRLGTGQLPMQANIQYPERRFSVDQDNLLESMYQFGEKERWLHNVPICLSLTERFISGFYANHKQLLEYAKKMILQLTVLHSYDEVKLVVLYDESDEENLSFLRWIPHTMDNAKRIRYLASTPDEAKNLSADLDQILDYRMSLNQEQLADETPYYVVICLSKKLGSKTEFLRSLMKRKENYGFSLITMYEKLKDLPKECSAVVQLDPRDLGTLTFLDEAVQAPIAFQSESVGQIDMYGVTQILANTILDVNNSSFQLPRKYTFMEMLNVGMVEHLNLVENWKTNDPTKSLAAPIGIDAYGDPITLDLHERAHGPHGLIAGMTGSGKSETIISYILSMAIQYHPHEVAFILIDYKGGGMAEAFKNIPHTAGIITNLDGNEINRSLVSMQSELHRREGIFRDVSKQQGISNIDIYKYQKLYRQGKVSEPLPHLIIVSDEFAELKRDQQDFMDALTSTARVGRSLGVHLILATQKPGGVVDDQIRSNSRFRLCLKVQDRGDSTEMMGRPEAASLVDTGRFYLQIGNNEVFELGQSAWAGAPYHPSSKVQKELDDALIIIDKNGRTLVEANTNRYAHLNDASKQLDVITKFISRVCEDEQICGWKMWLDPIPARITASLLRDKYAHKLCHGFTLNPLVGEYDDPAHQNQDALNVPLTASGNVIVYGAPGSGKTMFLEAMCHSLMSDHTPEEVNLYIMDFGAETMTAFANAPHTGDVVLSHETDKIEKLFKMLAKTLVDRKKLLSRSSTFVQYNTQASEKLPNIVVMIHNYANFSELCDQHVGELAFLTREGTRYGIFFVLTCTGVNNVRLNMQQNFKNIYCLQLNNSSDYSVIVGKTGGLLPSKNPGRGMFRFDKDSVLEFQVATCTEDSEDTYSFYSSFCQDLYKQHSGNAPRIPTLPEQIDAVFLAPHVRPNDLSQVPVGVEKESLRIATLDLTARPIHVFLSQNQEYRSFTSGFSRFLAEYYNGKTILFSPGNTLNGAYQNSKLQICADHTSCISGVNTVFQQVLNRNNTYKTALAEGKAIPEFEPLFVVIQSISELQMLLDQAVVTDSLNLSMNERLLGALIKCYSALKVFFVLADSEPGIRPLCSTSECKSQISKQDFIWIGNGINEQYWWNVNHKPYGYTAALDKHFGYSVSGGKAVLVKFLHEERDEV